MAFDLDEYLKDAENTLNPGLNQHVESVSDPGDSTLPDVDAEEYVTKIPKKEDDLTDDNYFSFEGEKVGIDEFNEAVEALTDPGYERELLQFYAKLVSYNKILCEPIVKKDQMTLNSIGILANPIEIFIQRRALRQNGLIIKLLKEIRDNQTKDNV